MIMHTEMVSGVLQTRFPFILQLLYEPIVIFLLITF